jgi:hypothetical protein
MVNENRNKPRKRNPRKSLRYFYLDGDLHKVLRIIRAQDLIETWNFKEEKRKTYIWSDVRRRMGRAFSMIEVAGMIGRTRARIERDILLGNIKPPQRAKHPGTKKAPRYKFSEQDVYDLHDYLLTIHMGRPRLDGRITHKTMPSKAELRAMMKHDVKIYVKKDDGSFTPVWKEIEW